MYFKVRDLAGWRCIAREGIGDVAVHGELKDLADWLFVTARWRLRKIK